MTDETPLTAEERVTLALLSGAAKSGASDGELGALLASIKGKNLVAMPEYGGGMVHVKVDRVESVRGRRDGTTVITFANARPEVRQLVINAEQHRVERWLHEAGWEH